MGLLQDLASLALASAVRSAANSARLPDWLPRRVEEQLHLPSRELVGLLAQVSERAWHGLEFALAADALWELYGSPAPARHFLPGWSRKSCASAAWPNSRWPAARGR
jgi:hypothetical protein